MMRTEFLQEREHIDIIYAMEVMGFQGISKQGMCFGFSATAVEYYNSGKLAEYDGVIEILSNLTQETHEYFLGNEFSIVDFGNHLKVLLTDKDKELSQQNKLTISEVFTKVQKYQSSQENLEIENCIVLAPIVGIYDLKELHEYLSSLQDVINTYLSNPSGLAFLMTSSIHADMLCAEPYQGPYENESMLFRDINYVNKKDILIHSEEDLIFLKKSLDLVNPDSENLLNTTYIIIPKMNKDLLINRVETWKNLEEYKQIHELSFERITRATADESSLLLGAVKTGNIELVKQMFELCPNLQEYDLFPKALCFAIIMDKPSIINFFLEKEINNFDTAVESHGHAFTPFQFAVMFNNIEAAKIILDKNININIMLNLKTGYFLAEAAENNKEENIKNLFKTKLIDIEIENTESIIKELTPLHIAAFLGQTEIVNLLLEKNPVLSFCSCSPDELAEAMGHDEIAAAIREKYKSQLSEDLTILARQPLSNEAMLTVEHLQNNITNNKSSLLKQFQDYDIFFDICKLEQSYHFKNTYYKNKVISLYNDLISDNKTPADINKEISLFNTKEQLILERKEQVDSSAISNHNKVSAFSHFESYVLSDVNLAQCETASQTLKTLFNIDAAMEQAKKPSRFFAKKTLHHDWAELLDNIYSYFINKFDFNDPQFNIKLKKLHELITKTPNNLYESIDNVPEKYQKELHALAAEVSLNKAQKLPK